MLLHTKISNFVSDKIILWQLYVRHWVFLGLIVAVIVVLSSNVVITGKKLVTLVQSSITRSSIRGVRYI
jgi:hypothetical protein